MVDGEGEQEGEAEAVVDKPFSLEDIPNVCNALEPAIKNHLTDHWITLQNEYTQGVKRILAWHRQQRDDIDTGVANLEWRFLDFLQRPHNMQRLLDEFVFDVNKFTDEYPAMRSDDATKEELHVRAHECFEKLTAIADERVTEGKSERDSIVGASWDFGHIETMGSQIQALVWLEYSKFRSSCVLLKDFYHSVIAEPMKDLPGAPEPIQVLAAVEDETEEDRQARLITMQEDEEGNSTRVYPFLEQLFTMARALTEPLEEWVEPDSGSETEAAGGKKDAKKVGKAGTPELDDEKGVPKEWAALQQGLLREQVHYLYRLKSLEKWATAELNEFSDKGEQLWDRLAVLLAARGKSEKSAIASFMSVAQEHIESESKFQQRLELTDTKCTLHPNTVLFEPAAVPPPPVLEQVDNSTFSLAMLQRVLHHFSCAPRTLATADAEAMIKQLTTFSSKFHAPAVPPSWPANVSLANFELCSGNLDTLELLLSMAFPEFPNDEQLQNISKHLEKHAQG